MSEKPATHSPNDGEIDLSRFFVEIKRLFVSLVKTFFSVFFFIYKHKFVLILLLIIGVALGYFWDKTSKGEYNTNLTLVTNYNSTDYLYNKINALETKIKQEDTVYLESVFGSEYKLVKSVEINPVLDIYKFIAQSEANKEIFELLLDEQDNVDEFLENPVNSYNYPFHRVKFYIKGQDHHKSISNQFISYINDKPYFNNTKEILIENYKEQLAQNKQIINQIDRVIDSLGKGKNSPKENLMVSINENQTLDNLLQRKKDLLINGGKLKTQIQNQQEIITTVDSNYALENKEKLSKKDKKYLLPLFLIGLYLLIYLFRYIISKSKKFYTA